MDELERHVHQHHGELPHRVPEQPERGSNYSVHDAGHPGRDLQRPGAAGRRPRADRLGTHLHRRDGDQPTNIPPVASFTYSCNQNVCTFDGRASTDENPTSLTYTWNFGTQGTATGPLPTKTFTAPPGAPFQVTLTVRDEWQLTHTSAPQNVTIVEPAGNSAPVPTFIRSCNGLTCSVNSQGTADPNTG